MGVRLGLFVRAAVAPRDCWLMVCMGMGKAAHGCGSKRDVTTPLYYAFTEDRICFPPNKTPLQSPQHLKTIHAPNWKPYSNIALFCNGVHGGPYSFWQGYWGTKGLNSSNPC